VFSILSLPSRLALHNEFPALNVVRVNGFDYALHKYFPSRFEVSSTLFWKLEVD